MKLLRKGKVKEVYVIDEETLLFKFTDNISVFDKIIPSQIPKKGEILCKTSAFWFERLNEMGIKNHFIKCDDSEMFVKRFQILNNPTEKNFNYLIPLEFIARYYLAGSLYERIKKGKIDYHTLGFKRMPDYGEKLPEPFFEITTKFEEFDRKVDFEEAKKIGGLSDCELSKIKELIFRIDDEIQREVKKRNLIHVDGKKEFALGNEREIYVVDTFGTMDEDRWWDLKKYEKGKTVELSKEFVRQYYKRTGYYERLTKARIKGLKEPEIPPLPEDLIKEIQNLYENMFFRITGLQL